MRSALLGLAVLLATPALRAQEAVPADTFEVGWTDNLEGLRQTHDLPVGARFVLSCPPNGSATATVWGTGTYTSDSAFCLAAAHAGALTTAEGGKAVVEAAPGLAEYVGTLRHGVASLSYPAWHASFRFPHADTTAAAAGGDAVVHELQGDWDTVARQANASVGSHVRFACSPGGSGGSVWGTAVYTDDSSICEAAVHAGVIERADGGVVRFELTGPNDSYAGSVRNGVSTMSYPSWPGSFRFVDEER